MYSELVCCFTGLRRDSNMSGQTRIHIHCLRQQHKVLSPDHNVNTFLPENFSFWLHHRILLGVVAKNLKKELSTQCTIFTLTGGPLIVLRQ